MNYRNFSHLQTGKINHFQANTSLQCQRTLESEVYMKLARLENQPLKDTIYYILVLWEKENFWGKTFDRAYMTEKAARRKARELMNTGKYSAVQLRKEDVLLRDENHEYSSSTPIKRYEA